jgi:hypothetical protein
MMAFHVDPKFMRWLRSLEPRQELIVRTSLRDRIRDPATARAWAHRVAALEADLIHTEADIVALLADVRGAEEALARAMPVDDGRPMPGGRPEKRHQ